MTWDRDSHEGNFLLCVNTLTNLQWLFHALDHHNYARTVVIHLLDMGTLQVKHPDVFRAFCEVKFAINKTHRPFSRMPLDERENNACGTAVGLTEKSAALLKWMVSGPEMARVATSFSVDWKTTEAASQPSHHEDKPGNNVWSYIAPFAA